MDIFAAAAADAGPARMGSIRAYVSPAFPVPRAVGTNLSPILPFLKCYSLFVGNFANAQARLQEEDKHNEAWREFCAEKRSLGVGNGLSLSAMLLCIVQRIPRYRLLLAVGRPPHDNRPRPSVVLSAPPALIHALCVPPTYVGPRALHRPVQPRLCCSAARERVCRRRCQPPRVLARAACILSRHPGSAALADRPRLRAHRTRSTFAQIGRAHQARPARRGGTRVLSLHGHSYLRRRCVRRSRVLRCCRMGAGRLVLVAHTGRQQ